MTDMSGRVCFVTGSTHGIGLATATALARAHATVVVHGRDPSRVDEVSRALRARTGNRQVSGLATDFSALADVRRLAEELGARHDRLHVLVNNAGAMTFPRRRTADGFEWHFGVNHLAPFLLTNLLLDRLKASAPARIVTVASSAHRRNPIRLDDLNFERDYEGLAAYGRSKFANILFTMELVRRLAGSNVTANAVHPGYVVTNLATAADLPRLGRWVMAVLKPLMLSPDQGAAAPIYLASSPEVAAVTGKYFVKCKEAAPDPRALDADLARRLWERSAELTGLAT